MLAIRDAVCVLLCIVGAVIDVRTYRIPNWLTASAAVLGLTLNAVLYGIRGGLEYGVLYGAGPALLGGAFVLVATFPLGALRLLGMGDVKLLGAAALFVRWPAALHLILDTALAGGVLALVLAVKRGLWATKERDIAPPDMPPGTRIEHRMPYGVAIAIGAAWVAAARHLPWLRLL